VCKEGTPANIYRVMVPNLEHQSKQKITKEHAYKEWGVSTNRGKYKEKSFV